MGRQWRVWASLAVAGLVIGVAASASASRGANYPDPKGAASYWTPERRAQAVPRDLVFDEQGRAYLRQPGGVLRPYGHEIEAEVRPVHASASPAAGPKPGGDAIDTTPPTISGMDPSQGQTIGAQYTFKATVTDTGG